MQTNHLYDADSMTACYNVQERLIVAAREPLYYCPNRDPVRNSKA